MSSQKQAEEAIVTSGNDTEHDGGGILGLKDEEEDHSFSLNNFFSTSSGTAAPPGTPGSAAPPIKWRKCCSRSLTPSLNWEWSPASSSKCSTAYLIGILYIDCRSRKEKEGVSFKNHVIQWFEVLDGLLGPYWKALGLAFNCTFFLFGSVIQLIACASNIYINDHLDKRTWTYIFGACCATTVFIPSFHNYRVWSFLGLGMNTYTAWYLTAASMLMARLQMFNTVARKSWCCTSPSPPISSTLSEAMLLLCLTESLFLPHKDIYIEYEQASLRQMYKSKMEELRAESQQSSKSTGTIGRSKGAPVSSSQQQISVTVVTEFMQDLYFSLFIFLIYIFTFFKYCILHVIILISLSSFLYQGCRLSISGARVCFHCS